MPNLIFQSKRIPRKARNKYFDYYQTNFENTFNLTETYSSISRTFNREMSAVKQDISVIEEKITPSTTPQPTTTLPPTTTAEP